MIAKKKTQEAKYLCNRQIEQDFRKQYASMLWNMTKAILNKVSKDADKQ